MKEISKKVILEVTLYLIYSNNLLTSSEDHEYVRHFINSKHKKQIRLLQSLNESIIDDLSYTYYINITELQRYKIYVDNFVDNIYIFIRDILQPDNDEKKRRENIEAYAADHYKRIFSEGILKNPRLLNDEDLYSIRQTIKES